MIYLDSNIFLYAILYNDKKAVSCRNILLSVVRGDVEGATSFLTWDEVVYIVLKSIGGDNAVREGKKLLELPNLKFVKVDEKIMRKAQELIREYRINPRDAIHAASAVVIGAKEIVSDDKDFDLIREVKRKKINS